MLGEEKYAALAQKVELFHGLSTSDIAKIVSHSMTIRIGEGETIFYKGTTGNQLYVVLSGQVAILDGKERIATLSLGDMFGEMALVNEEPRSATAVAIEPCHLFMLNETTFHKLLTKHVSVQLLLNIIKTLSHRLRISNEKLKQFQASTLPPA